MLSRMRSLVRAVFGRRRLDREMREEMTSHIEQAVERLMARGMTRQEAEREARREFGSLDVVEEEARDARGARWIETTLADMRYALRQFRRTPGATTTMLLVLSLGIGANVVLFTVLHSMQTMPAPGIPRDDRLARIRPVNREFMTWEEVREYARLTNYFSALAAEVPTSASVSTGGADMLELATVTYVTDGYFDVLGVKPYLGTVLPRAGAESLLTAMISHEMWQSQFGASPDALGRTLRVNDTQVTIVGVAPPHFRGTQPSARYAGGQIWMPEDALSVIEPALADVQSLDGRPQGAVVRLAAGMTRDRATAAITAIAERMIAASSREYSEQPDRRPGVDIAPLLADNARRPYSNDVLIGSIFAGATTLLILLITCTNVSALLVGTAVARRREIAVRLSLGAARTRVIRQLLTESVLLAIGAAALAVLIIFSLWRTVGTRLPDIQFTFSWPALLFSFGFAIITGMLFGLSPALHATRLSLSDVLKDAGPGLSHARSRLQRGLVVAQIALTQPLLVGLGAMIMIFVGELATSTDSPVEDRILHVRFGRSAGFGGNSQAEIDAAMNVWRAELERVRDRLRTIPGVIDAVAAGSYGMGSENNRVHPADRVSGVTTDATFPMTLEPILTGHLALLGIPLVSGRDFMPGDADSAGIIISSDFAMRLWGDAPAIGRRLLYDERTMRAETPVTGTRVIVGVYDSRALSTDKVFSSLAAQRFFTTSGVLLRTSRPAADIIPAVQQRLRAEAPDIPVTALRTLSAERAQKTRTILQASTAAGSGGLLALFLAAIGLYSLVSLGVKQRTREIGIRSAQLIQRIPGIPGSSICPGHRCH